MNVVTTNNRYALGHKYDYAIVFKSRDRRFDDLLDRCCSLYNKTHNKPWGIEWSEEDYRTAVEIANYNNNHPVWNYYISGKGTSRKRTIYFKDRKHLNMALLSI